MIFLAERKGTHNMNMIKDCRISEVRNIVETVVGKADREGEKGITEVLVLEREVAIFVDKTVLFLVPLKNYVPGSASLAFRYCDICKFEDKNSCIHDVFLHNNLIDAYNLYIEFMNTRSIVASDCKLRDNEEFEKLLSLKSDQGMRFYKLPGIDTTYLIPVFSGFPSLNKGDEIGIEVYDLLDGHLLNKMIISKKKINRDILLLYRTLKLN